MYISKLQTESDLLEKLWTGSANTFGRSAKIDFIYNSLLHMIRSQHKNFLKTDYYIRGPDFPLSINSINFRRREKGRGPPIGSCNNVATILLQIYFIAFLEQESDNRKIFDNEPHLSKFAEMYS